MTYAFGTEPVDSTPEAARWYKLTPAVIAELAASYPADAAIRDMVSRVGASPVFMGVAADDLYWMSATSQGNIGGNYKTPAGPLMTYAQVLRVFAPSAMGPDTKPVFRRNAVVNRSKTGLYVGIAVGIAALLGVAYVATRKKTAPAALAKNARIVGPCASYTMVAQIFGVAEKLERELGQHPETAADVRKLRKVANLLSRGETRKAIDLAGNLDPALRDLIPAEMFTFAFIERHTRDGLHRNAPIASTPEMQALYAEIEAEKAARSAPRRVAWTPMRANLRRNGTDEWGRTATALRSRLGPAPARRDMGFASLSFPPPSKWPKPTRPKPSQKTLEDYAYDIKIPTATDGCRVEPDGTCQHGHVSWLRYVGWA